ncbi:MAG: hypothetical protein AB7O43_14080 [Hyphomicrobiaceae bacterium]
MDVVRLILYMSAGQIDRMKATPACPFVRGEGCYFIRHTDAGLTPMSRRQRWDYTAGL